MKICAFITVLVILSACSSEYNCEDTSINPVFIKFQQADIDTFIVRKYAINSNFTNQLDSMIIVFGRSGYYISNNDTTIVQLGGGPLSIKKGFEWQIYLPAKNKIVNITGIESETSTGKCNRGLFSMDKVACTCTNRIFSYKKDNVQVNFTNHEDYKLYITN